MSANFHSKNEPLDTVRRRRCLRLMQPTNLCSNESSYQSIFSFETNQAKEVKNKIQLKLFIYLFLIYFKNQNTNIKAEKKISNTNQLNRLFLKFKRMNEFS